MRRMEDLLYELSVVGVFPAKGGKEGNGGGDAGGCVGTPLVGCFLCISLVLTCRKCLGLLPAYAFHFCSPTATADADLVPLEDLEGIRQRLVQYDETREVVIKVGQTDVRGPGEIEGALAFLHLTCPGYLCFSLHAQACRDVQKNSKNAIYSVHRQDFAKAKDLLDAAK